MDEQPVESQEEEVIETPEETPEEQEPNAVKKDRTKQQIEKLKTHNQELKAELENYKNLFESSRPIEEPIQQQEVPNANNYQNLNQQQVNDVAQGMIDENGYLDGAKLMSTLQELDARAKRAEQTAAQLAEQAKQQQAQARQQQEQQAQKQIYEKYPGLNADNTETFDPKFYNYVYNELASKAKRGEMPTENDYMAAADKVYNDLYEGREDVTKKEQAAKTVDQKLQINATRPRSSMEMTYFDDQEDDALMKQVQNGKRGAVGALLRRKGM